jgi:hypothetical protein
MNVILAGTVFAVALSTGVLVCLPQAVRSRFKLTKEFDNRIFQGNKEKPGRVGGRHWSGDGQRKSKRPGCAEAPGEDLR